MSLQIHRPEYWSHDPFTAPFRSQLQAENKHKISNLKLLKSYSQCFNFYVFRVVERKYHYQNCGLIFWTAVNFVKHIIMSLFIVLWTSGTKLLKIQYIRLHVQKSIYINKCPVTNLTVTIKWLKYYQYSIKCQLINQQILQKKNQIEI